MICAHPCASEPAIQVLSQLRHTVFSNFVPAQNAQQFAFVCRASSGHTVTEREHCGPWSACSDCLNHDFRDTLDVMCPPTTLRRILSKTMSDHFALCGQIVVHASDVTVHQILGHGMLADLPAHHRDHANSHSSRA